MTTEEVVSIIIIIIVIYFCCHYRNSSVDIRIVGVVMIMIAARVCMMAVWGVSGIVGTESRRRRFWDTGTFRDHIGICENVHRRISHMWSRYLLQCRLSP